MLTIISPAKSLEMESVVESPTQSFPELLNKSEKIAQALKKKTPKKLAALMDISPKLAQLNFDRYQQWHTPYAAEESKQAIFAFSGEVYSGIDVQNFTEDELLYTQEHLRILSGLYGLLRPMDLILAYRLEMGTKLSIAKHKTLYSFWGDLLTKTINQYMADTEQTILINLASNEYFKSLNTKKLNARLITPIFKDHKNGTYKVLSFFAKKARGLMTQYLMKNRISSPEDIKHFDMDGYFYNDRLSEGDELVFTRG